MLMKTDSRSINRLSAIIFHLSQENSHPLLITSRNLAEDLLDSVNYKLISSKFNPVLNETLRKDVTRFSKQFRLKRL